MLQFQIRKSLLFALSLTGLLLVFLLALCIIKQQPTAKILILSAIMLPVLAFLAESWRRRISFGDDAIVSRRLFRQKSLLLADVTAVDTVRVRRRVFISISTEEDFLILSNNYDHFDQLLCQLQEHLPEAVISNETRALINDLPGKCNNLFSIWLAVIVLLLVIYVQLGGTF